MPNPLLCILILIIMFFILLALCIFTQFFLLIKNDTPQEEPQKEPTIYKIKRYKQRKKRKKSQDNTITIEGRLISPDEFKREN